MAGVTSGGCSDEPLKIFRGTFELMKFFAERKCPGPQGEQGPRGCQGAAGGGAGVSAIIQSQVCREFAESASGIQDQFWTVLAGGTSEPLAGYCTATAPWGKWGTGSDVSDLRLKLKVAIDGGAELVTRRTRKDKGFVVARTVLGVGEARYVVTSVEEESGAVLFVSSTAEMGMLPIYVCSIEKYLLDLSRDGSWNRLYDIISRLGNVGGSEQVQAAYLGGASDEPAHD